MTDPSTRPSRRPDIGRLVVLPIIAFLILANAVSLASGFGDRGLLATAGTLAALAFYIVVAIQYLRRPPAEQTDRRPHVWLVAMLATSAPFLIPLAAPEGPAPEWMVVLGSVVILVGVSGAVWAAWTLGRNFSIVPQARGVASDGPYRYFRHPLYVFELVAAAGLALVLGGGLAWVVVAGLVVLQVIRARWEEALLTETVPGYSEYRAATPGVGRSTA